MSSDREFDVLEIAGSGEIIRVTAGEAITNRDLVYLNADGMYYIADASVVATLPVVGIALHNCAVGFPVTLLVKGYVGDVTTPWAWTTGSALYASDTAGAMSHVAGTVFQQVGEAISATQIWFNPQGVDTGAVVGAHILATTGSHTNTLPLTDLEVGVRGEVIIRGAADWEALGVGVALQALLSGGAGADPYWGAPTPAAHEASHRDGGVDELEIDDLPGAAGAAGEIVESDGAAMSFVEPDGRYDPKAHVLATTGPHTNTLPLADLAVGAQGEIIHRGAADWAALAVGAAGEVLTSGGAGANVSWAVATGAQDVLYPAPDPDDYKGTYASMLLTDGQSTLIRQTFYLPNNYVAGTWAVDVIVIPDGTGDLRWGVATNWGAVCADEDYQTGTDSIALGQSAVTADEIECLDIADALTGALAGDLIGIEFTRDGGNGSDTVDDQVHYIGIVLRAPAP